MVIFDELFELAKFARIHVFSHRFGALLKYGEAVKQHIAQLCCLCLKPFAGSHHFGILFDLIMPGNFKAGFQEIRDHRRDGGQAFAGVGDGKINIAIIFQKLRDILKVQVQGFKNGFQLLAGDLRVGVAKLAWISMSVPWSPSSP